MTIRAAIFLAVALCISPSAWADQVEMQNGDHYAGKVVSMTAEDVVLQSEVLGKIILPRSKVANINLSATAAATAVPSTNHPSRSLVMTNGSSPDVSAALRSLGANTNLMEQVRQQFLSDAGPDANKKFDELAGDLMNGRMDMNSLRAQAKAAEDQIRALKGQGGQGGAADDMLDSYLAILDSFLKETATTSPPSAPVTNTTPGAAVTR
jgi:hypothetical protein